MNTGGATVNRGEIVSMYAGLYGLRDRNESGDLLADLCVVNELVVSNNTFQQHPRRLYTSISPGDRVRN